jgi:hypothetical protein
LSSDGLTRNLPEEFRSRISESFRDSAARRGSSALGGSSGFGF